MKIGKFEITRNKAPQTIVANSYADSVASGLADRGFKTSVNGRPTGTGYTSEQIEELYRDYIFAAIRKTRNKVADILANIEVYDAKEGNQKDAPSLEGIRHPYQDAIDNASMDNNLFYQAIATFIMLTGEGFIYTGERTMQAGNIKATDKFELLQSNQVVRTYNDEGAIKTYKEVRKLPNGLSKDIHYVPSNIIALIDFNPIDMRKGYGMIRPVVEAMSLESMSKKLQIATLANSIKAPGMISTKEKIEKDDFEDLKHQVDTRWTSNDMDKAGTPIVTNGSFISYESLLEDLDKLAMVNIRKLNRDAFIAALGASKTILGIEESGTTRDVSRTQTENFILDTCMPLAESIINGLNQDYINNYPKDYAAKRLRMRVNAPIEKDMEQEKAEAEVQKTRAEAFKTYIDAGMEPDLAARLCDLELEKDEKIVLKEKAPLNTLTLTNEQLSLIRNVAPVPPGLPAATEIHNHIHNQEEAKIPEVATNSLTDTEKKKINNAQAALTKTVKTLDGDLCEIYIKGLNAASKEQQERYINDLVEALLAYYLVVVAIFGKKRSVQLANDFAKELVPFTMSQVVEEELKSRLAKVSNEHFQTIHDEISRTIAKGVEQQMPNKELVKLVRDKVDNEVKTWEVERLVNTESLNAYRQSTYFADKQFITHYNYSGRAYKIWRTNSPAPCEFCLATANRKIPFEGNFYNKGDVAEAFTTTADGKLKQIFMPVRFVDVNAGGLHPNCRCDYQLVIE